MEPLNNKRPAPPTWKILLYCVISLAALLVLGYVSTALGL